MAALALNILYTTSSITLLTKDTIRGVLYGTPILSLFIWGYLEVSDLLFRTTLNDLTSGSVVSVFPEQDAVVQTVMDLLLPLFAIGVLHWIYRIRRTHRLGFPFEPLLLVLPLLWFGGSSLRMLSTEGITSVFRTGPPTARQVDGDTLLFVTSIEDRKVLWSLDLSDSRSVPVPNQEIGLNEEEQNLFFEFSWQWRLNIFQGARFFGDKLIEWDAIRIYVQEFGSDWITDATYPLGPRDLGAFEFGGILSVNKFNGNQMVFVTRTGYQRWIDPVAGKIEDPNYRRHYSQEYRMWRFNTFGGETEQPYDENYADYLIEVSRSERDQKKVWWSVKDSETDRTIAEGTEDGWPFQVEVMEDGQIRVEGRVYYVVVFDLEAREVTASAPILDFINPEDEIISGDRRYFLDRSELQENEWRFDARRCGLLSSLESTSQHPSATPAVMFQSLATEENDRIGSIPCMENFVVDHNLAAGFLVEPERMRPYVREGWQWTFRQSARSLENELRLYDTSNLEDIRFVTLRIPDRMRDLAESYSGSRGAWKYLLGKKINTRRTPVYPKISLGGGYLCLWVPEIRRVALWDVRDPANPHFLGLSVIEDTHRYRKGDDPFFADEPGKRGSPTTPIQRADGALGFFLQETGLLWLQFPELAKEARP
jgi:hypothetical protein